MIQLTPQSRIFLATEPVDFRKGIDGLAAVCRQRLGDNPLEGAVYVFRNRSATALKLLIFPFLTFSQDVCGFPHRPSCNLFTFKQL
jgi:IS66 Orf2 like protein